MSLFCNFVRHPVCRTFYSFIHFFFRIEEVETWMNSIDENVKIILKQLSVSQDIDKEKEAFLVSFEYKKIQNFPMHL